MFGMIEVSYSEARARLAELLDRVTDDREVVRIRRQGNRPGAVIIDADEYASLEETAYLFVATDRVPAARRAVAAALALQDEHLPPERHPLLRMLLASGLARLTGAEMVGSRRAAEVLLEVVERATQRDSQPGSGVETRPSGLILPR